jgi:hypothetical protein
MPGHLAVTRPATHVPELEAKVVSDRVLPSGSAERAPAHGRAVREENQQFWGTRTVMDVIHLGPGIHSLRPEVRLSGNPSTSGIVARLCAIAEAYSS